MLGRLVVPLMFVTGCVSTYVDAELQPYVSSYHRWLNHHCMNIRSTPIIRFSDDLAYPIIGRCLYVFGMPYSIDVKRSWWKRATEVERRALMIHELTHCALDVDHMSWGVMVTEMPRYTVSTFEADIDLLFHQLDELHLVHCLPGKYVPDP